MYNIVLEQLGKLKWDTSIRRKKIEKNNKRPKSMIAGKRFWRQSWGKCRLSNEYPNLDNVLKEFISEYDNTFEYTTVTLNKNFECLPHFDSANVGESYIIALGNYTGGELNIEGTKYDIRGKWLKFNGSEKKHWVEPFIGDRYSLVYYKTKGKW